VLYVKDLRIRLTRVAKEFKCALADLTPADIDKFLMSLKVSSRSRTNFRLVVGTSPRNGCASRVGMR
jgi:hypothetical protein